MTTIDADIFESCKHCERCGEYNGMTVCFECREELKELEEE